MFRKQCSEETYHNGWTHLVIRLDSRLWLPMLPAAIVCCRKFPGTLNRKKDYNRRSQKYKPEAQASESDAARIFTRLRFGLVFEAHPYQGKKYSNGQTPVSRHLTKPQQESQKEEAGRRYRHGLDDRKRHRCYRRAQPVRSQSRWNWYAGAEKARRQHGRVLVAI